VVVAIPHGPSRSSPSFPAGRATPVTTFSGAHYQNQHKINASDTDHVGSNDFNSELSQKRAQSVVDYMISKGINAARLVAKGYGETWPKKVTRTIARQHEFLNRNDELTEEFILKLTPEQQEIAKGLNRRTEFRVLSNDFHE
jgi:peptidoglycan-associated lipoprotein